MGKLNATDSTKKTRLPDTELLIMQIVWRYGGKVTSAEIMKELEGKKDWATTTVLNLLARLVERKFVSSERTGKTNIYTALVSEEAYLEAESKSFLARLHGNSLKSFIASLYGSKPLSTDDIDELKEYLEHGTIAEDKEDKK